MKITAVVYYKGSNVPVPVEVISFYKYWGRYRVAYLDGNGAISHVPSDYLFDVKIDGIPLEDYKVAGDIRSEVEE